MFTLLASLSVRGFIKSEIQLNFKNVFSSILFKQIYISTVAVSVFPGRPQENEKNVVRDDTFIDAHMQSR